MILSIDSLKIPLLTKDQWILLSIHVFDMESGARRLVVHYRQLDKPTTASRTTAAPYCTALDSSSARMSIRSAGANVSEFSGSENIEQICILTLKGKTLVTVGTDGNLCFWDGTFFRLVLTIPARHAEMYGLVDVQTDKMNNYLVSGDQGGFVKVWDIKDFRISSPRESQVKLICFWQAHDFAISAVDIVPYPKKSDLAQSRSGTSSFDFVVVTCSTDKKVLVWSSNAILIGQLGQGKEWILDNMLSWESNESMNTVGDLRSSPELPVIEKEELENEDYPFLKPEEKSAVRRYPRLRSAKLQEVRCAHFLLFLFCSLQESFRFQRAGRSIEEGTILWIS